MGRWGRSKREVIFALSSVQEGPSRGRNDNGPGHFSLFISSIFLWSFDVTENFQLSKP